jgi:GNAT superfamily N-acetyltransferase
MNYIIRRRTKEDISGIQKVVTTSWNETYKGIVPDWFLEELKVNEDERIKNVYDSFDENDNNQFVLIVDNEVVGFVNFGKTRDEEYQDCGEIFALYVISKYKGNGFGKKLVETAKNELKKMEFNKMLIACLKGNPSNEFYKHIGGVYVKDGLYKRLQLKENVYYYEL